MPSSFAAKPWSIRTLASGWRWDEQLTLAVDRGLWSLVVLAPLVWGGRSDVGRLVYATLASLTALAWLAHAWLRPPRQWVLTPVLLIPLAAIAWVSLQLVPLPAAVVQTLAPRTAELLALWQGESSLAEYGLGTWHTLSLNPGSGQISLTVLLCYVLVLFVALQRIRTLKDVGQLLQWIGVAAVVMAVMGLLQYYTADGLFFWVYEHPFRRSDNFACGTFINRNHFASFLAMGAAAIAYEIARQSATARPRSHVRTASDYVTMAWCVSLAVVLLALVMSASRGGVLAAAVGAVTVTVIYWRRQLWATRQLVSILVVVALLGVGISVYSEERLTSRIDDLATGSLDAVDRQGGRRAIWTANLRAIADGWLVGSGAGTHRDIYPVYLTESFPKVFTHAENGYLQVATELGLPGVVLLAALLACAGRWTWRAWQRATNREAAACYGAVVAGLAVSLAHSVVDFVWYLPATMLPVVLLLVALRRLAHGDQSSTADSSRADRTVGRPPLELVGLALCVVAFMLNVFWKPAIASPAWNRYLASSAAQGMVQEQSFRELATSGDPGSLGHGNAMLRSKILALRSVVATRPRHAAAHVRLARAYLQWFDARCEQRENRMTLGQIQSAVLDNHFSSGDEVRAWLATAIGDDCQILDAARQHARRAVQLAPMEGLAYVCLANVRFLDHPTRDAADDLLAQAAAVRPHDGDVLFEIGKQHLVAGNLKLALDFWTRCFRQEGHHRLLVVATLAGRIPAADFLHAFEPDWHTMRSVWQRYLPEGDPADLQLLLEYADQLTHDYQVGPGDVPAAYVWSWLGSMYSDAGNTDKQLRCLEQAMAENGQLLPVRKAYAVALYHAGQYAAADPHLRWCLARDPAHKGLRTLLHQSAKLQHQQSSAENRFSRPNRFQR